MIERSVCALAESIRKKEISSLELVTKYIERTEEVNPLINAVVQFFPERALDEAKKRDQELHEGKTIGPLRGIPYTL